MSYRLAPAARADLRSIWLYTRETWGQLQADQYVVSIERACEQISSGERQGRSAEQYRPGYMSVSVGSHFVFYKSPKPGGIDVIRVLHQRMDIATQLSEKSR